MILNLDLHERSYDIVVEQGCLQKAGSLCNLNRKVLVVTDSGVPAQYATTVAGQCSEAYIEVVPAGEQSKSLKTFEALLQTMIEAQFTRNDCVVAVGGGVVGDLAGFVAASYMRGVDFYNIPTTVLAQVDSSIGGKTAINLGGYKNMVGAFYQPRRVLIDLEVLHTLAPRQIANGLAESIKMALTSDAQLFELFEHAANEARAGGAGDAGAADGTSVAGTASPTGGAGDAAEAGAAGAYAFLEPIMETIIERSLRVKKHVVEQDEHENGMRKILNFGHTIGHGIEACTACSDSATTKTSTACNTSTTADDQTAHSTQTTPNQTAANHATTHDARETGLYHGECVALGMIPFCAPPVRERLLPVLHSLHLPTEITFDAHAVIDAIEHDKKRSTAGISVITVPKVGTYTIEQITAPDLQALLPLIQKKED